MSDTINHLHADDILNIPVTEPERLFTSPSWMTTEYKSLMKIWHTDINHTPEAAQVSSHINLLHQEAKTRIANGVWHTPGILELLGTDRKKRSIRYYAKHPIDIGEMYYGDTVVCFVIRKEFRDLSENYCLSISDFSYRNDGMKKEFSRYLPKLLERFEMLTGDSVIVINKTPDTFLLHDVLTASDGVLSPDHVAWIMNRIYNILCYLNYTKFSHNDISPFTCFVSPEHHSILLLGGWWYSAPKGKKLTILPVRSHKYAYETLLRSKRATSELDLTLVRVLGRELLGDSTGMTFPGSTIIPSSMGMFLRQPTTADAFKDYTIWDKDILPTCFGKRRFVKMDITKNDITKLTTS